MVFLIFPLSLCFCELPANYNLTRQKPVPRRSTNNFPMMCQIISIAFVCGCGWGGGGKSVWDTFFMRYLTFHSNFAGMFVPIKYSIFIRHALVHTSQIYIHYTHRLTHKDTSLRPFHQDSNTPSLPLQYFISVYQRCIFWWRMCQLVLNR